MGSGEERVGSGLAAAGVGYVYIGCTSGRIVTRLPRQWMSLFSNVERQFAVAVSELSYCNPFLPCRIEFERAALGSEFDARQPDWNLSAAGIRRTGRRPRAMCCG